VEANARKVGKVLFKTISSECVGVDNKGVNRLISKKIVKRKKKGSDDSSVDEYPDITENGCPAEVLSYSDDNSALLEMQAVLVPRGDNKGTPRPSYYW